MSEKFVHEKYDSLFDQLSKAIKRVEVSKSPGRKLTNKSEKLNYYKTSIIESYNDAVKYITLFYKKFKENDQKIIRDRIRQNRAKIDECFVILQIAFE